MPPKNSGGSTKFPGGHKVIHRTAQTAFVRVVTPRGFCNVEDITAMRLPRSVLEITTTCRMKCILRADVSFS